MVAITVIGGGVNGLACAVKIKEKYPNFEVVLISNEFSPNTTGDGSGGLWYPYLCGNTPEHLIIKWGCETYRFLHKLWLEGEYDISLMPMYYLYKQKDRFHRAVWYNQVFGYQELELRQLEYLNQLHSSDYTAGETFTTFVVFPPTILAYLLKRFESIQGKVINSKISSLQDPILKRYNVVVNCTGLGSRDIVPDDTVFSIRGQIAKVSAPWICQTIIDKDRDKYIIPNAKCCVLGGTRQTDDYNLQVDEKDSHSILNGCHNIIPTLKNAKLITQWVGLRPGRHEVRLESEIKENKLFIHNYGHGGSGVTLFWGCATDVLDILERNIRINTISEKSKL